MARPRRCRRVCAEPDYGSFRPDGIPGGESVTLTVDEYEVIRLIDLEKLTHEQCAKRMDISRTTVTEIYESAREKIADSIVNGKVLMKDRRVLTLDEEICRNPKLQESLLNLIGLGRQYLYQL